MVLRLFRPSMPVASMLLAWLLVAAPAGAIDLDALKRLARADATQQARQEAAEKAEKDAKADAGQAGARAANAQFPPKPVVLSGTASQMEKLARGIEEAHAAAPNRWYQAAKIEDVTPPGDDQRKIYKITGVLTGSYCVRYKDKNKGDQGNANVGEAMIGSCPHMF